MKKRINGVGRRILAMALALFMVCTSIPLPVVTYATEQSEEVKNNKALTIYIKGKESEVAEDLVALSNATVQYTVAASEVDAKAEGVEWTELEEESNEDGKFILPADLVATSTGKNVYIKVTCDGYDERLESVACDSLTTENQEKTIEMSLSVTTEEIKNNAAISVKVTDADMQFISENLQVQYIIADSETLPEDSSAWISVTRAAGTDGTLLVLEENSVDKSSGCLWVKVSCEGYISQSFSVNLSECTEAYTQEVILKESVNTTVSISDANKATVVINNETVVFNESNTGTVTVPDGETISYKIIANDGFYVKKVTIGEDSEDLSIEEGMEYTNTFSASDAVNIQIEIGQYYTVSVSEEAIGGADGEDGGTVTLNTNDVSSVTVDTEDSVAIQVTPSEGFIISSVVIGNEEKITDNADKTTFEGTVSGTDNIKVQFTKIYTITVTYDDEKGAVTDFNTTQEVIAGSVTSVVYGSKFKFTATPKDGYRVISVKIDDTEISDIDTANNSTYTSEVSTEDKTNHTVEITFALNVYGITTNTSDNGSVVLSTATGSVEHFGEVTVTVTPDSGYTMKKDGITVNNTLIDVSEITRNTDGTYTFKISDVKENKEISVEFCKISAGKDTDYTIDDANALRSVNGNYFVLKENDAIIFTTEQEKIRVYKEGEDSPVEDTESLKKVGISGDAAIVAIDAYYCAENEMFAEWHTITLDNSICLIVDSTPTEVSDDVKITPEKNEYGYYNENVTISILVTDNGDYSGIGSIEYFITNTEDVFGKAGTVTEYDSISDIDRTILYTFETGNDIKQSISLEDIQKSIVVNAEENNSPYTKVWIKVMDRAGNAMVKTIALPINATSPEMELAFSDTKEIGVTGKYYTSRELQITVKDRGDTFLAENVLDALKAAIKKNGDAIGITESDITWDCVNVTDCEKDVHIGTCSFEDDGTYTIDTTKLTYVNKAGMQNVTVTTKEGTENVSSFVIDNAAPDSITVEYKPESDTDNDKYYKDYVDVILTAKDTDAYASGIKTVQWKYIKLGASSNINEASDAEWTTIEVDENNIAYSAEVRIPRNYDDSSENKKQFHGYLMIQVTDWAGHVSTVLEDNEQIFIIDNKAPEQNVFYAEPKETVDGQAYYDDEFEVIFFINEANFDARDVKAYVSKDGNEKVQIPIEDIEWDNKEWTDIEWDTVEADVHVGRYTINGNSVAVVDSSENISNDGDYKFYLEYTDKSGNKMVYESHVLTIDETEPEVKFSYDKESQEMTFTVIEHNFRPEDVFLVSEDTTLLEKSMIQDVNGKDVSFTAADLQKLLQEAEWTKVEGATDTYTYTCTTDQKMDGIYNLNINYTDISQRQAVTCEPEQFVVDHKAPEKIEILYDDVADNEKALIKTLFDKVLETVTLGFYKPKVKVTFVAYDAGIGVESFSWKYTKQDGASTINRDTDTEYSLEKAGQDKDDLSKYTATITLPKVDKEQLRGYLTVYATDAYGNGKEQENLVSDLDNVIIVDSIAPTMTAEYSPADRVVGTTSYYNDIAEVTFTVTEANFYAEDVEVMVSKDGGTPYVVTPKWTDTNVDTHVGTLTLSGDGDYVITVNYTDNSTNQMTPYVSHTITIDTIQPIIDVVYENTNVINTLTDRDGMEREYFADTQTAVITITEHNFNAEDVVFDIKATDVIGTELDVNSLHVKSEWKAGEKPDTHVLTITYPGDANYIFDIAYSDLAMNASADYATDYFTVDKTTPVNLNIEYSTSILEDMLEKLSFGFYNAKVTATITAEDEVSGVNEFIYSYKNADGVSKVNAELINQVITSSKITYSNDGKTATAQFEIPKDVLTETNQFNGTVSFNAIDRAGYENTLEDAKRIIVDNIVPTMTVEYSVADRVVGTTSYYNDIAEVTFTVTEANFYAEDVEVMVSKDGGTSYVVTPKWTDTNVDTHVGTFTLSGDGDYVITVNYTDRSTNQMTPYVSHTITIDTIQPIIDVVYENTNVINTLTDRDGMEREYFADTQTAVITITEHNFNAEDVVFDIKATDVIGTELDVNSLHVKSEWKAGEKPDTHVLTITYPGDANYIFDIAYSDLATNACADYAKDYFTVDKTGPTNLNVTYSTSILETILETILGKIPFGFYNAKVDVTISADDMVSGVHEFVYSYKNADGVSEVNAELINQAILASEITYSNAGKTATAKFQIPKDVLTEVNQFNGTVSFDAMDRAGCESTFMDNKRIVVDNIAPTAQISYNEPVNKEGTISYYDGNVTATIVVTEANFYAEDVVVMLTKDGGTAYAVTPTWEGNSADIHTGTFILVEDGDYFVTISYRDKSSNEMVIYTSEQLTIDTQNPELDFSFDRENQKMVFTVTEHNFRPQDISLNKNGTITDINGKAIEGLSIAELESILQTAEWTENENDVYTYEITSCPDGIYNFEINYTDLALRNAETCKSDEFIIDHTVPSNVEITYSKSLLETILETITFGFYKADVKVTFTAYDQTAGVDYFTWNYTKENGASDINRATDVETTQADAVQDAKDKSKFTATITLPDTDAKQLRGYLAAAATDNYANAGEKVTDSGRIVVVDSIAPIMTAEYSAADRVVGTTSYYNDIAEVTFTVTEANFYAEDVEVMVSKDGGTAYAVTPKWTDKNVDTHVGTFTLSGDGDYVITVNYTDRSTNQMTPYVSHTITIDTIQPIIDVVYENTNVINTLTDRDGMEREYFADTQTAVITITEHNFNAEDVVFDIKATDVIGTELDVNSLHVKSEWKAGEKPDTHVLTITYPGDANYTFDMAYSDLATNASADYATDYFTVDNTTPINLNVAYSTSILETILEAITFGFYDAKVDVTLTADDEVSGVHEFMYSYTIADGVSAVNAELINQAIAASDITYSNVGKTATVHFEIPKDVLTDANQFNGIISFEATDRAGLKNTLSDNKRIIVDNIAPTAQVTYSEPVNTEGTISYYDGNVNATVVITEANFYAEDVSVMVSKDGGASYEITPTWDNNSVDIHTGTFTLTEDGDYFITINYRDKSSNEMVVYTSEQLTIDTDIQEPTITFNGNNEDRMAYKGEIIPEISFSDVNYDSFEVFLYRTYMDAIGVDITEEKGIHNLFSISEETGNASLNVFGLGEDGKYNPNDDGIYRLLITMQDKAGHTIEKEAYFTINRYGSVYAYNEYLVNLIADGGAFVNAVTEDLVITEYNADRLVTDSLDIEITRDGKPLEDVKYTVSPVIDENASVGSSGWYQYEYVISKENFILDGIYKISISSTDATGNKPENSNFEDKNILFYVDSTVPEITSITGLEKAIVDATELEITYMVFDAIGLKAIKIYVDDEILQEITDFTDDFNNYSNSFVLEESEDERAIRIVVEDMAGNITDTAAEDFTSAYVFNDGVTVTTNAFVRFYANKPLFYGAIVGTAGVAGLAGFGIRRFRLKKKTK